MNPKKDCREYTFVLAKDQVSLLVLLVRKLIKNPHRNTWYTTGWCQRKDPKHKNAAAIATASNSF
jgi:hypothetical protein